MIERSVEREKRATLIISEGVGILSDAGTPLTAEQILRRGLVDYDVIIIALNISACQNDVLNETLFPP